MANVVEKEVRLNVAKHTPTGLLMASSEDMPGLMVAAHSDDELRDRLPKVMRALLEAEGKKVLSVYVSMNQEGLPPDFVWNEEFRVKAKLAADR